MSGRNVNYRDTHLNQRFNHRSVLNDTGMYDAASEAMEAISQEASYDSTNPGLLNDLFGAALYVQSNLEANFFGALPKVDMTGENTTASQPLPLTFRAAYDPPALQTHAEGGDIPSGRTYEIEEVSADIKRSLAVIEQADLEQLRAELLDGVPLDELTRVDELYQDLAIDRDAIAAGVPASNGGYSGRDKVTELDVNFDADDGGRESVNDAQTRHGIPGTTRRRHYKGIPIVENQNAPTHGSIPSIYVIPTDTIGIGGGVQVPRLAIEEYAAPYVETAGRGEDQGFLSLGSFENKVLYKMDHELVCRDFSATGKLRDLSE